MADPAAATSLFEQVFFRIILSDDLEPELAAEIKQTLEQLGGVEHSPPSTSATGDLTGLSHIISSTIHFEGYEEAERRLLPVVKPSWIETSILKKKLSNPKAHNPDPRLFFSGVVLCTADLPEGDKDAIIGGVLAMGGLYSGSISKLVTHIVAMSMEPDACKVAVAKNLTCKIVLPHWFDDCLRLGKRIDEGPYTLPNPDIMTMGPDEHIGKYSRTEAKDDLSTCSPAPQTPPVSPSKERKQLSVFKGRRICLSGDLEIEDNLLRTYEKLILDGGGIIVQNVAEADIYVCRYREGHDYRTASTEGKTVGNLNWLYHLIKHNSWTSPFSRLLHYPMVREGLPGFKNYRISLSNYNGDARIYLENLAKAAGGEFTKTMKMDNTHLITAHTQSEKCDAAKEWNIDMINHLWLEESYAKWEIQSISNPRYNHFPPRTNLTEVVGKTPLDKEVLERHFFPRGKGRDGRDTSESDAKMNTDSDATAGDNPKSRKTVGKAEPLSNRAKQAAATPKQQKRTNSGILEGPIHALRTPASGRKGPEGKENETPSTTGSRGAKDRAVAKLHDLVPDIALYEKEKKRVGGVIFGGRRKSDETMSDRGRKRSASISVDDESDMPASDNDRQKKRPKKGPPLMRLLVTGYKRWAENTKLIPKEKEMLRNLGILITESHLNCTHVAAPRILRTQKFVCAVARAPVVVSTDFVEACIAKKQMMNPADYLLKDRAGEKQFNLDLAMALKRAQANKGGLLRGQSIWVTEDVAGGFDTYKAIIHANGGTCMLYKGRPGPAGSRRVNNDDETDSDDESEYMYLVSGESDQSAKLWPKFRHMIESVQAMPRIVKNDWLLDLALSQKAQWNSSYEVGG